MKYKNAEFEKTSDDFQKMIEKCKNERKGIFIYGDTGTGKTYNLYALENKWRIKVYNWVEIMFEIKDKIAKGHSVLDYVENLINCNTGICIDDIGAEKQTEYSQEIFYLIINKFYTREKLLFMVTNLSITEFQEKYGDRLFSRIVEMCNLLEIKGEDKRFV